MRSMAIRGPEIGDCAICQRRGPLTVDHVPPKGAVRISAVEMTDIINRVSADPKARRAQLSQNGVKFRSLCAHCNNVLLGAGYDLDLIAFTAKVSAILRTSIALPQITSIRGRPHFILRSIVGHLLGAGMAMRPSGPFSEAMAAYVLDPTECMPDELDCYYWPYPYNDQVIIQNASMMEVLGSGQKPILFKLIKFYPLAFLFTWASPAPSRWQLENLCHHRRLAHFDEAEIPLRIHPLPHQLWPEAPQGEAAILYGEDALHARPVYRGVRMRRPQN